VGSSKEHPIDWARNKNIPQPGRGGQDSWGRKKGVIEGIRVYYQPPRLRSMAKFSLVGHRTETKKVWRGLRGKKKRPGSRLSVFDAAADLRGDDIPSSTGNSIINKRGKKPTSRKGNRKGKRRDDAFYYRLNSKRLKSSEGRIRRGKKLPPNSPKRSMGVDRQAGWF